MKKMSLELFPVIAFVVAFFYFGHDFFLAAKVLMAAMAIQILIMMATRMQITTMQWVSFVLVILLGSVSVFLHNEAVLQWKITIVNLLFALAIYIGDKISKKPIMQHIMGAQLELKREVWLGLSKLWIWFFVLLAVANTWIMLNYSIEAWMRFKLFGVFGAMFIFMIVQGVWLHKKAPEAFEQNPQNPS